MSTLLGALAPAIASVVMRKWLTREGFADAGSRLNLRQWRYYLARLQVPGSMDGYPTPYQPHLPAYTP